MIYVRLVYSYKMMSLVREVSGMKTNEGTIDRVLRIIVGIALIALAATGTVGAWGYIGVVPLVTGLVGWCGLYQLLGINTCPTKKS